MILHDMCYCKLTREQDVLLEVHWRSGGDGDRDSFSVWICRRGAWTWFSAVGSSSTWARTSWTVFFLKSSSGSVQAAISSSASLATAAWVSQWLRLTPYSCDTCSISHFLLAKKLQDDFIMNYFQITKQKFWEDVQNFLSTITMLYNHGTN